MVKYRIRYVFHTDTHPIRPDTHSPSFIPIFPPLHFYPFHHNHILSLINLAANNTIIVMENQVNREKFNTIMNLTYLLHVVAGTIIVVSIRNHHQEGKEEESKVKLDDLDNFLRCFLLAMEIFCDFSLLMITKACLNECLKCLRRFMSK
jgi:hypothetical protein